MWEAWRHCVFKEGIVSKTNGTSTATAEKAALATVGANDPLDVHRERIGEREYSVEELTAYRFLALGDLVTEQAEVLGKAGLLNQETFKALDDGDFMPLVSKLRTVWREAPDVIGRFFALILSAEAEDDPDYILRHIKLITQVPRVLRAFMKANPWTDLVEGFFHLREEFQTSIGQLREEGTEKLATSSQ